MVSIAMIGAAAFKLFRAVPFDNVDAIVPTLVAEHTNAVVSGIFLCGILAAGLSTTVALVLTSSGAVTKDIYEDYYCARSNAKQDSGKSVRISRIATGIILVVVVIGSIYPPDFIWSLSTMSAGVMGAAFTAPLVLGLYWKRATRQGCMAGIIGGVCCLYYLVFCRTYQRGAFLCPGYGGVVPAYGTGLPLYAKDGGGTSGCVL